MPPKRSSVNFTSAKIEPEETSSTENGGLVHPASPRAAQKYAVEEAPAPANAMPKAPRRPSLQSTRTMRHVLDTKKLLEQDEAINNRLWFIIDPRTKKMAYWDLVTALALIWTAIATPVEVAFLESPTTALDALFIINRMIDLVFVGDMVLQFCLMFRTKATTGATVEAPWETRPSRIAANYMKGWFALDMLSIFPSAFDIPPVIPGSGMASGGSVRVLRVVRVARLIKLVRLVRSSRMFSRWQTSISLSSANRTLMTLFAVQVPLLAHWIACLFRLVPQFGASEADSWLGTFGHCWDDGAGDVECVGAGRLYVDCWHWSAGGLVAGYAYLPPYGPHPNGELPLMNTTETAVLTLLQIFGARASPTIPMRPQRAMRSLAGSPPRPPPLQKRTPVPRRVQARSSGHT
jgi:hypothetical protein